MYEYTAVYRRYTSYLKGIWATGYGLRATHLHRSNGIGRTFGRWLALDDRISTEPRVPRNGRVAFGWIRTGIRVRAGN